MKRRRQDRGGLEAANVGAVNEKETAVLDHISRCTTVKTANLRGVSIFRENSIMIMDFLPRVKARLRLEKHAWWR